MVPTAVEHVYQQKCRINTGFNLVTIFITEQMFHHQFSHMFGRARMFKAKSSSLALAKKISMNGFDRLCF